MDKLTGVAVGWHLAHGYRTPRSFFHSLSTETAYAYAIRLRACIRRFLTRRSCRTPEEPGRPHNDLEHNGSARSAEMELRDGRAKRERPRAERILH